MAPRTPEQNEKIREQRSQSIINAALKLFAENGVANTSISQIAKEADTSKGLIYNYFSGKRDLLHNVIQEGMEKMPLDMPAPQTKMQARQQLELTLDQMHELAVEGKLFWKFYAELLFQLVRNEELSKEFEDEFNLFIDFFTTLLDCMDYPDPQINGRILAAKLDGILLHGLYYDNYPTKQIFEQIKKTYLTDETNEHQ
ncbi:transcriptional regulator, TetR family [Fodinibius salinus]|uniref:Transcriptional regulator, TetR family n=1 Tax=Fodinibius salinus TaxID=860790 RepID=A0A5D3YG55_9BACT|nr:TetR/AcrR family transcriptional regulator [Fodinibius salinus]TYP91983.1 transcriptional regulator, TetR family [Fodinibius salinus]